MEGNRYTLGFSKKNKDEKLGLEVTQPLYVVNDGLFDYVCRHLTTDEFTVKESRKNYAKYFGVFDSDSVWLDAGGCIGTFAIPMSLYHNVVCVEPSPANVEIIHKNIDVNFASDIVPLFGAVVGDNVQGEEVVCAYSVYTGANAHGIVANKLGGVRLAVPAYHINDLILDYGISLIKLDVEGAELDIIRSISDRCWDLIDFMYVEFHVSVLGDRYYKMYEEVLDILDDVFDRLECTDQTGKKLWIADIEVANRGVWYD